LVNAFVIVNVGMIELLPRDFFLLGTDSIVFHLLYCHQDSLFFPQEEYWSDLEKYVVDFKNEIMRC